MISNVAAPRATDGFDLPVGQDMGDSGYQGNLPWVYLNLRKSRPDPATRMLFICPELPATMPLRGASHVERCERIRPLLLRILLH